MEIASPRGGFARWAHGRHAAPPVPPFYLSSRAPSRASRASSATHGLVAPLHLAGADRFETCLIVQNDHTRCRLRMIRRRLRPGSFATTLLHERWVCRKWEAGWWSRRW